MPRSEDLPVPRVLVVDDEPAMGEIIETYLPYCEVRFAGCGQDALQCMDYVQPSLVILDAGLPGLCGISVLKRLRQRPETRHVPVLMLSRSADMETVRRAGKAGANSFLLKPVDRDALVSRVARLLDTKRGVPAPFEAAAG